MPTRDGFRSPSSKLPVANARLNNPQNVISEVLEYKLSGKSINDVLEMTVRQALEYFKIDKITSSYRP